MPKENPTGPAAARVLRDCHLGKVNDVVELDAEALAAEKADGSVDDHPDAVAYAQSLAAPATPQE
jgi:hypothetical protein